MGMARINNPDTQKLIFEDLHNFMLVLDAPSEQNDTRLSFSFKLKDKDKGKDNILLIALVDRNKPSDRWYLTVEDTWLYTGDHSTESSVGWHREDGTICIYFYRQYNSNAPAAFTVQHMRRFYGRAGLKRALARIGVCG